MRETGPIRADFFGDTGVAKAHLGQARTLLGILKARMAHGGLQQLTRTYDLEDGTRISVRSAFGQDSVIITSPTYQAASAEEIDKYKRPEIETPVFPQLLIGDGLGILVLASPGATEQVKLHPVLGDIGGFLNAASGPNSFCLGGYGAGSHTFYDKIGVVTATALYGTGLAFAGQNYYVIRYSPNTLTKYTELGVEVAAVAIPDGLPIHIAESGGTIWVMTIIGGTAPFPALVSQYDTDLVLMRSFTVTPAATMQPTVIAVSDASVFIGFNDPYIGSAPANIGQYTYDGNPQNSMDVGVSNTSLSGLAIFDGFVFASPRYPTYDPMTVVKYGMDLTRLGEYAYPEGRGNGGGTGLTIDKFANKPIPSSTL